MTNGIMRIAAVAALMVGCAGTQRNCASGCAAELGADWVIVQYKTDGTPINCWKLHGVAVATEAGGIFWQDTDGHLVHVDGWSNRVQVNRSDFTKAAAAVGVDEKRCGNGAYQ